MFTSEHQEGGGERNFAPEPKPLIPKPWFSIFQVYLQIENWIPGGFRQRKKLEGDSKNKESIVLYQEHLLLVTLRRGRGLGRERRFNYHPEITTHVARHQVI